MAAFGSLTIQSVGCVAPCAKLPGRRLARKTLTWQPSFTAKRVNTGIRKAIVAVAHRLLVIAFCIFATALYIVRSAAITLIVSIPNEPATASCADSSGSVWKLLFVPRPTANRLPSNLQHAPKEAVLVNASNVQFHANTDLKNQKFSKERLLLRSLLGFRRRRSIRLTTLDW